MSQNRKYKYYDEYGKPVDEYGNAINPQTGRTYIEEAADEELQIPPRPQTGTRRTPQQPYDAVRDYPYRENHPGYSDGNDNNPAYQNSNTENRSAYSRNYVMHTANSSNGNGKHRKRKSSIFTKLLCLLMVLAVVLGAFIWHLLDAYTYDDTNESSIAANAENGIMNLVLFGVDSRAENEESGSRSDAIMIMSVDPSHSSIKLISLMRDSYVDVPGYGKTKLCHAYGYGGPQLMMQTINEAFDMNIKEYMEVDFAQMASIIDAVGGVTVTLTEDELAETNKYINDYCWKNSIPNEPIAAAGEQKLSGIQAMTYGRIRKGNTGGDWQRTERQSLVLNQVFSKATHNPITLLRFMNGLMPNIKSSMSKGDFLYMGGKTILHGLPSLDHLRLPLDGEWQYSTRSGMSVIEFSDSILASHLKNYIFNGINPTENTENQ